MDTAEATGRRASSPSDLGLLLLRIGIGATMIQAGLIKALDFDAAAGFMADAGWRSPTVAAAMVTASETIGGIGLLLGLLTPVAACAVSAAMIDAWAATVSGSAFWTEPFNVPFVTAFGAAALLFTGAGAYSLDGRFFGRSRWPGLITATLFLAAVGAAVATWVLLNGVNPIHLHEPAK
jgi:putative oxidoreductase